jgi:hypothetical protein
VREVSVRSDGQQRLLERSYITPYTSVYYVRNSQQGSLLNDPVLVGDSLIERLYCCYTWGFLYKDLPVHATRLYTQMRQLRIEQ